MITNAFDLLRAYDSALEDAYQETKGNEYENIWDWVDDMHKIVYEDSGFDIIKPEIYHFLLNR